MRLLAPSPTASDPPARHLRFLDEGVHRGVQTAAVGGREDVAEPRGARGVRRGRPACAGQRVRERADGRARPAERLEDEGIDERDDGRAHKVDDGGRDAPKDEERDEVRLRRHHVHVEDLVVRERRVVLHAELLPDPIHVAPVALERVAHALPRGRLAVRLELLLEDLEERPAEPARLLGARDEEPRHRPERLLELLDEEPTHRVDVGVGVGVGVVAARAVVVGQRRAHRFDLLRVLRHRAVPRARRFQRRAPRVDLAPPRQQLLHRHAAIPSSHLERPLAHLGLGAEHVPRRDLFALDRRAHVERRERLLPQRPHLGPVRRALGRQRRLVRLLRRRRLVRLVRRMSASTGRLVTTTLGVLREEATLASQNTGRRRRRRRPRQGHHAGPWSLDRKGPPPPTRR
mmetsp:Transcript_3410/g.13186  ORF Transcript_3410/g.13186 Transcript_3410/m.13186 type:complete len:403 (+) Transcript_3410:191-1399(+)